MPDGSAKTYAEWAEIILAPELDRVAPAVGELLGWLGGRGAPAAAVDGIRLAVVEGLTNAIKHGRFQPDDRRIELRWSWPDEWLQVRISEPGNFTPPPAWTSLPDDPLAESGRGGFLIAQAFEELAHENTGGRHTLRLRKRLGAAPYTPAAAAEFDRTLTAMTEDLSASYETLAALFKLAEALATTETLPAFAAHVLQLRELMEADTMHVRIRDTGGQLVLAGVAAAGCDFPRAIDAAGDSLEAEVFRTGKERTMDKATRLAAGDPLLALNGPAVVCPVYFQARGLGVCVLGRHGHGAYFTAAQLSLARTIAEFLGIACANAELQAQRRMQISMQRELEIAAQIQQSLVPKEFPCRHDWRVHGLCANALEAGGDFLDVLEVPGGLLLVIADVMGKGVSAALLAVVVRTAVRAHVTLADTPGRLLTQVSGQIAPDLERLEMFITVQVVFLEANSARLSYANAGHCPLLALAADGGSWRTLAEGGLPLGVSQAETYAGHDERLAPNERILLSTDGLIEAPDDQGRELGIDGLGQAALAVSDRDVDEACRGLLALVQRRDAGRAPTDDRTLIILQRLP